MGSFIKHNISFTFLIQFNQIQKNLSLKMAGKCARRTIARRWKPTNSVMESCWIIPFLPGILLDGFLMYSNPILLQRRETLLDGSYSVSFSAV